MRRPKARRTPAELARLRVKFAGGGHDWRAEAPSVRRGLTVWACALCGLRHVDAHAPPRSFQVNCAVRQVLES